MPLDHHRPGALRWSALCLGMALLGACAQPVPPVVPDCSAAAAPSAASLRMVLSFQQPVAGDAPETLAQLQRHSQACVRYAASVSPTVHAYVFTGVSDATLLRQRLLGWALVREAVVDQRLRGS